MIPGELNEVRPSQILIYARGNQGTGALPLAGASITVPHFSSVHEGRRQVMNYADASTVDNTISTATHGLRRYVGLYEIDIALWQNVPATIELRERNVVQLESIANGMTDTFRSVYIRQVRASAWFRQTWRIHNAEAKIIYTNGGTDTAQFSFLVTARSW